MPPPLDLEEIHDALQTRAIPALETLLRSPDQLKRTRNRFDRDEPPPYYSSTDEDMEDIPLRPETGSSVLQEFAAVIDAPLDDRQADFLAHDIRYHAHDSPGVRFKKEATHERHKLSSFKRFGQCEPDTKQFFRGERGIQRESIVVRHNIKKRWQRLGIWNPQWGIPGRDDEHANDEASAWRWKWQRDYSRKDPDHPAFRAVRLRQGLRRDEHSPVPPRSKLPQDASTSQGESFITSRPFFIFELELGEEDARLGRIPLGKRNFDMTPRERVAARWKERGDWKEGWEHLGKRLPGWKWRHESPSPEPEDLTRLNTMEDMDFTPSEVDAFEAIPPTPSTPSIIFDPALAAAFRSEPAVADDAEDGLDEASADTTPPVQPPARAPGRPRRAQRQDATGLPETQAQPQLRRSSRIAAMQAKALRTETQKATKAAPAAAPRKRGRPKVVDGPAKAPARAARGGQNTKKASAGLARAAKPQGVVKRGRPPKADGPRGQAASPTAKGRARKKAQTASVEAAPIEDTAAADPKAGTTGTARRGRPSMANARKGGHRGANPAPSGLAGSAKPKGVAKRLGRQ